MERTAKPRDIIKRLELQATGLQLDELARLLDGLSFEYYLTGQMDQAVRLREEAIRSWRESGQVERTGDDLRWLSRIYWFNGNKQEADRYAAEAIDLPWSSCRPGRSWRWPTATARSSICLPGKSEPAIAVGEPGAQAGRENPLQEDEIIVHALTNIGTAELFSGDESG